MDGLDDMEPETNTNVRRNNKGSYMSCHSI